MWSLCGGGTVWGYEMAGVACGRHGRRSFRGGFLRRRTLARPVADVIIVSAVGAFASEWFLWLSSLL